MSTSTAHSSASINTACGKSKQDTLAQVSSPLATQRSKVPGPICSPHAAPMCCPHAVPPVIYKVEPAGGGGQAVRGRGGGTQKHGTACTSAQPNWHPLPVHAPPHLLPLPLCDPLPQPSLSQSLSSSPSHPQAPAPSHPQAPTHST